MTAPEFLEQFAHPYLKSRPLQSHEVRRALVNRSEPRPVILIWVVDVDVTLSDELFDRLDELGAILLRGTVA